MSRRIDMHGFTLIELMITIVMLSILAAIAVPNFMDFVKRNRLQAQAEELRTFLHQARSEAAVRRATVSITIDANGPWELTRNTEVIRAMDHNPDHAEILANVTEVEYRPNGTATAAVFTVCHDDEPADGYLIEVKASGATALYKRGTKDHDDSALTSCTP